MIDKKGSLIKKIKMLEMKIVFFLLPVNMNINRFKQSNRMMNLGGQMETLLIPQNQTKKCQQVNVQVTETEYL